MGKLTRTQAWLTYVTRNDHLTCALVLAESLRRTKTTRRIAVITGGSVSGKAKCSLRRTFDDVFLLDQQENSDWGGEKEEQENNEMAAKIFAFSLDIFDKCIFLEPNSLLLENSDKLFEAQEGGFIPLGTNTVATMPNHSDFFLMTPCPPFSEWLGQQYRQGNGSTKIGNKNDFIVRYARKWMENNLELYEELEEALGQDENPFASLVMQLSLDKGEILKKEYWGPPSIIQLVDSDGIKPGFVKKLQTLWENSFSLGLAERAIIQVWLKLFEEKVAKDIYSSTLSIKHGLGDYTSFNCNEPIAIIGISCRLPGANNPEEFWNLLYSGQEGIRKPPNFRWKKDHAVTPVGAKERETHAGFINSTVDEFDARFFGVSPKEAVFMDPQTRLLHEIMWESLENAGMDTSTLYGSHTGIFTGSWMNDYRDIVNWSTSRDFFRTYMGNSIGASAARLSFLLGLTGPCIATESGCSSAIVAVDMAVKSLRCGETNLALAGGVNLLLHPFTSNIMDYVIAPDGRCKTFDAKADGFGRAEGCGFLVMKRLSDALRDRDHIWAMIRGSAVSQEGISRSLGTPTVHCEALAMQLALKNGGVLPEQVTFVETHGTGTSVGDPMEIAAIAKAYNSKCRKDPLVIGSVKTNVGHTESCSGITGIIKTVLAMQHELIPKHLNLETLNPDIDLETIPAVIPMEPLPWPKIPGKPRLAGVSSFGITGTDGHVILQEAPDYQLPQFTLDMERPLHLMKISTRSNEAMEQLLKTYEATLNEAPPEEEYTFADFAFTANSGRASFDHRAFLLASNFEDAAVAIQGNKLIRTEKERDAAAGAADKKICFLFTGQGSQYPGMAKRLYETSPVFHFHFDHCARTLLQHYNVDICQVLWNSKEDENDKKKQLSRTIYSQTSIFCVEYCLLKLWQSWGIHPDFVLGHSLGEFCAAVAAGMLTFEDALKLVAIRSQLIDKLPRGSMLVLKASKLEAEEAMKGANIFLDIAAVNSADQTVVAGDTEKICGLVEYCKENEMKCMILEASHAFHSYHMDAMLQEYRQVAQKINYKDAQKDIQYISGMEGKVVQSVDAEYWTRHTRDKVNFLEACQTLSKLGCQHFLEIGPHPVLSTFVLQNNEEIGSGRITCYPSLRRNTTSDWETILTSLGKLWLAGYSVDWHGFDKPYRRKKVASLPLYPFNRKSFWVECNEAVAVSIHPLIGSYQHNASSLSIFQKDLLVSTLPYLRDHCIGTKMVFPGAGFTEMCLAAGYCVSNFLRESLDKPRGAVQLENVRIEQPLELKEDKFCRIQVIVDLPADDKQQQTEGATDSCKQQGFRCRVFHKNTSDVETSSGKWVSHASATFYPTVGGSAKDIHQNWSADRVKTLIGSKEPIQMDGFYKRIDFIGLKFGETFRSIQRQWVAQQQDVEEMDEIVAEIKVPLDHYQYLLHPLIIDAMFQAQILAGIRSQKSEALRVPVQIGRLVLFSANLEAAADDEQTVLYIHAKWTSKDKCSVYAYTKSFSPVALIEDLELLETNVKTIQSLLEQQNSKIPDCWEQIWRPIPGPEENRLELGGIEHITSSAAFAENVEAAAKVTPDAVSNAKKIDLLVCLYTLRALYQLGWIPKIGDEITTEGFCQQYKIKEVYRQLVSFYFRMLSKELGMLEKRQKAGVWRITKFPYQTKGEITAIVDSLHKELVQVETVSVIVKIHENVANNLVKILLDEESPLSILFPPPDSPTSNLSAEHYYQNHPNRAEICSKYTYTWNAIWNKICEENGGQDSNRVFRLLEVGAGTGSLSVTQLHLAFRMFGNQFEYYFTDISASFFSRADRRLDEFRNNIKFIPFNVEESPLTQGIPLNYFDCVAASDVLHATRDLKESLMNMRMTLRPRGHLIFTETLAQDSGITFVFGLLEGYWRFQDFERRPEHACIPSREWEQVVLQSGFSYVHSVEGDMGLLGVISAEASSLPGYEEGDKALLRGQSEGKRKRWITFSPDETGEEGALEGMLKIASVLEKNGVHKVDVILPWEQHGESEEDDKTARIYQILRGATGKKDDEEEELQGIIYGWGMKVGGNGEEQLSQRDFTLPFLHIAKYILGKKRPPKLYVLTRNVQTVSMEDKTGNPWPATLLGMAKSLKNESQELFVRCVDFEGGSWESLTNQLLFELVANKESRERERVQVAYRRGVRHEPRFRRVSLAQQNKSDLSLPPSTHRYKLLLPQSRMISDLSFTQLEQLPLGEMEVEVRTQAFALNFRDIFAILKPTKEFESVNVVGLDFAGVVTKLGDRVTKLKLGDRVFGVNSKDVQLPSHLAVEEDFVFKLPPKMTFAEAATLPTVFATTIYCLYNVANLRQGETVLIHTGSGGVGLSAIQLAKKIGANIITTASSPRKRAYLRSLGIEHVFHSRNTSYQQEIMKVTNGRGVDVLLNSITGPGFKEASLAVCAPNARFVEMSKLAVWTEEEVRSQRADVHYTIVDLTKLDRQIWTGLHAKTTEYLESGQVTPIPYVKFDALRIRQAFQYFQKAKHIGKVIVQMPEVKTEQGQWKVKVPLYNPDSTYIITGGLGGIGFEVCKWMLERGATDIVLVGRNPPKAQVAGEIERLNKKPGNNVFVQLADVGNFEQCKNLIKYLTCGGNFKPIRGIHHCAGVIWDNLYGNQTWESFAFTFNPKVEGTWNLHRVTQHLPLEHFVLYSSITALVGTPGQANHSASNSFEDAFALYRYSLGLAATTVNWGQWAQVGCAKEVNVLAVLPVSVTRMLNGLEELVRNQRVQVAYAEFESLKTFLLLVPAFRFYMDERLLKSLNDTAEHDCQTVLVQSTKFWQQIDEAQSTQEKMDIVSNYMKVVLRTALRMDPNEPIKDDANLQDLGVDSLMLIELRNSIQSLLGSRLSVNASVLKDCQTLHQLATAIVNKIEDSKDQELVNVAPLSPEELEKLVMEDCQLEENITPASHWERSYSQGSRVLLTGATGQLGPYVLRQLCQLSSVSQVICLIRTSDARGKLERALKSMNLLDSVDMEKVECVTGDIIREKFGMEEEQYERLCESVDVVIHLAAKSNHVEPYRKVEGGTSDVRSVNVGGTLNILRFAVARKTKCVYYASSILAVMGGNEENTLSDDWPLLEHAKALADNAIPAYPVSKFVSEMLIGQAVERGVPCKVFRFPWILGDSATGQLNYQHNHYILRFITYLKLKSMPSSPLPAIVLPVELCADWSLRIFWNDLAPSQIYNITHPTPLLEVDFVSVAKEEFGVDVELKEWENTTFLEKLYGTDMPMESLKEIYEDVDRIIAVATSTTFQAIQGYLNFPDHFFRNRKLEQYVPGYDKNLPTSTEIIRRNLIFVKSQGYFTRFGL